MLKKIVKKIAVATNILLFLQLTLLGLVGNPGSVLAANVNSGALSPSGYLDNNGWNHPENVYDSDDERAKTTSSEHVVRYKDFNFSVPSNVSVEKIDGIEVMVEGYTTGTRQAEITLSWDNGSHFTSGALGRKTTNLPGDSEDFEDVRTYGGSTDKWGRTAWAVNDLSNQNLQVRLQSTTGSGSQLYVDNVAIKIYYSTVEEEDNEAPKIEEHEDVYVEATSAAGAVVDYVMPVATDDVDENVEVFCDPENGSEFEIGVTLVTCNAEDIAGNEADPVTFNVIVEDTTGPEMTAEDIQIYTETEEGKNVDTYAVTAVDLVDGPVDVVCDPEEGSLFELGETIVTCTATDDSDNEASIEFTVTVVNDPAPIINVDAKPLVITNVDLPLELFFSANEKMKLSEIEFKKDGKVVEIEKEDISITDKDDFTSTKKVTVAGGVFEKGEYKLLLSYVATDENGIKTKILYKEIKVDTVSPLILKNVSAIVNESGSVVLTWTNPNKNEDYKTLSIYRDGVFLTTLPVGTDSFVDLNVEKGKTYSYEFVLGDEAGNQTKTVPVSVTTPAPVVAAVASDIAVVTPPQAANSTNQNNGQEVKSATDENKDDAAKEEEKEDETKEKFPLWGLIILLMLVGVGGYLYFSSDEKTKPIAQNAPKISSNKSKKPVTKKKKK